VSKRLKKYFSVPKNFRYLGSKSGPTRSFYRFPAYFLFPKYGRSPATAGPTRLGCFVPHRQQLQCTRLSEFTVRNHMLPQPPKLRRDALAAPRGGHLSRRSPLRCAPRWPPAFPSKSTCLDGLIKGFLPFLNHIRLLPLPYFPLRLSPSRFPSRAAPLCLALPLAPPPLLVLRLYLRSPIPFRVASLCSRTASAPLLLPDRSTLCAHFAGVRPFTLPFPADLIHHRRCSNNSNCC
jgi:hypothetical protein